LVVLYDQHYSKTNVQLWASIPLQMIYTDKFSLLPW